MVTSNLVHKLEKLTQMGVRDVPTERSDQRTMGTLEGKGGEQTQLPSEPH